MSKPVCVISTVGQSVFFNASEHIKRRATEFSKETGSDPKDILTKQGDFPGKDLYEDTLAILQTCRSPEALRIASAELNSLDHILAGREPHKSDQLHFLASETPDGALAARVMADFCAVHFERRDEKTKAHLIEGLQVQDGERFRRYGLRNLIKTLYSILNGSKGVKGEEGAPAGTYTRILNPTGGFKGVVPYLTIIGMIEPEIEVSYIYERSPELITLAGLPVNLDYGKLEGAYKALAACQREKQLSYDELAALLDVPDQPIGSHPAWPLFDRVDVDGEPYYELNGLGEIVYQHLAEERKRAPVYLSKQAAQRYDSYDKTQQKKFAAMFDRMGDTEWRESVRHATKGDAIVLKQGNTDARPLIIEMGDGSVLVAELTLHSDGSYDKIGNLRRKDYDKFRKWEGK